MKQFIRPLFLFGLIAFFAACNSDKVQILEFSPVGEVKDLQTFTIEFSKDLAPEEILNEWVDDEFVEFDPAIEGRFKWVTPRTLLFSPDRALVPSQSYKAEINSRKVIFDKDYGTDFEKYEFFTPLFDVAAVDIYWKQVPRADHEISVQANLTFSYDVDPSEVAKYLEVRRGSAAVSNFQVMTEEPSNVIAVNFGEVKQTKDAQDFTVTVRKGLGSLISRKLEGDKVFEEKLPAITNLAITAATSGMGGEKSWIEVRTTQAVDPDKLAQYVSLSPNPGKLTFSSDDNYFRIGSGMVSGNTYRLTVKKGLPGLYGGTLEEEFEKDVVMADLEPSLKFADRMGSYLMRGGMENLAIEGVNVDQAKVQVYEVFKNNILFFLYNNWDYQNLYYYDYEDYYDSSQDYEVNYYGKKLYEEELEFADVENQQQSRSVNLNKVLDERFKGIYVVQVRSDQDYWMRDAKLVAISDMGIIAKYSGSDFMVFVNSIQTAEPVVGATVKLISSNNQTLITGTTTAEGFVRFENVMNDVEGFEPRMVTVEKEDDFNFADMSATRVETSRYDVGGKFIEPGSYDAFVYSDRNIYRPGETAYLSSILRNRDMSTVRNVPITVKIKNPRGDTFEEYQKTLNEQGSFELGVKLPSFAQTGQYVAELYTGSDQYLTSYRFSVEEFVPDKIRVNLNSDKESVKSGETVKVEVDAEYLFGAPAAGHRYEMDVRLAHRPFSSKTFPKINFSNHSITNSYVENEFSEGTLDDEGKSSSTFTVPRDVKGGGYMQGTAFVSVFDVTGRTVNRTTNFKAYPKDYFLGIGSRGYYYGTNKDVVFDLVAVNPEDKAINNFGAEVELIRYEWQTVLTKSGNGRWRYTSEQKQIAEWKRSLTLGSSPKPYSFQVTKSGRYELRVYKKGSSDYVSRNFYAYYWGSSTASSFEINKEGQVEIILDKEEYKPGEQAKALFVTPFTGKMLVTVEREEVMDHFYVDVTQNSTEVPIPITDAHVPNMYITATLFRPHSEESSVPFLVGHGFAPIKVTQASNKLPVEIRAPERVKPRTTQTITVKTAPNKDIFVTLAVVDEGILQVKGFDTPDPYAHMYAKRRLSVESFDIYEYLLPEVVGTSSPAGGDERGKRLNPVKSDRFKLLAKWSGIQRTNSSGEVNINIELPQYNGEVRLMAVAYDGPRFGSAEKPMKVSDDVILMPALPRFLSIGDSLSIPVSVMNTTDKAGSVDVKLAVEGPLRIKGGNSQSVKVGSKGTSNASFVIQTKDAVGTGKITFTTTGLDRVKEEVEIGIRPISPLLVESDGGELKAGETKTIQIPKGYLEGTQSTTLTISPFPAVQFSKHLRYLVGYPHGCLEQTTSRLFPQLYFNELAAMVAPESYQDGSVVYYIKEGIKKLEGMIRYDGSFSYWPGGNYHNWWGTVYATHFLLEAQQAGYAVDENVMNKALTFLSKQAVNKQTYEYYYWQGGQRQKVQAANKEVIYSLYVLALAGKEDEAMMNYYRARPQLLTGDTRYMLAGAYAHAKNYKAYNELVPSRFAPEKAARLSGGSFDSEARANAVMLNVLLDVDPSNTQIPTIVNHLSKMGDRIWSTQDRAWTFLALGKAAKRQANSKVTVEVSAGGNALKTFDERGDKLKSDQLNSASLTLKATGTGATYYFWNTEGIKTRGVAKEEDANMQIRRTYYNRNGQETNSFTQGELIVCKISLTGGSRSVENVAITDMIPAGFEIENPRLTTSADLAWVNSAKDKFTPQYLDVRDDRLLLFTDLNYNSTKNYYYLLRVVNTGTFQLPAIGADAMYDPEFHSYHGGKKIQVKAR